MALCWFFLFFLCAKNERTTRRRRYRKWRASLSTLCTLCYYNWIGSLHGLARLLHRTVFAAPGLSFEYTSARGMSSSCTPAVFIKDVRLLIASSRVGLIYCPSRTPIRGGTKESLEKKKKIDRFFFVRCCFLFLTGGGIKEVPDRTTGTLRPSINALPDTPWPSRRLTGCTAARGAGSVPVRFASRKAPLTNISPWFLWCPAAATATTTSPRHPRILVDREPAERIKTDANTYAKKTRTVEEQSAFATVATRSIRTGNPAQVRWSHWELKRKHGRGCRRFEFQMCFVDFHPHEIQIEAPTKFFSCLVPPRFPSSSSLFFDSVTLSGNEWGRWWRGQLSLICSLDSYSRSATPNPFFFFFF